MNLVSLVLILPVISSGRAIRAERRHSIRVHRLTAILERIKVKLINDFYVLSFLFSGYYAFIETSFPRSQGDKARMISGTMSEHGICSMMFCIHMFGATTGTLRVFTKDLASGVMTLRWSLSGDQGNQWKNVAVYARQTSGAFVVRS